MKFTESANMTAAVARPPAAFEKMSDLKYIPFYLDWIEMMHTKDTPEKQVAFVDGIFDYALEGIVPPSPREIENPHGTDYARRDGYLTARSQLDYILPKIKAGAIGGKAGKGEAKARFGNQNASKQKKDTSKTQAETKTKRKQNASETQALSKDKNNITPAIDNSVSAIRARAECDCHADSGGNHGIQRTQDAAQPEGAVAAKPPDDYPTLDIVLKVAADGVHRASGEVIPEDFAREWYALMETSQWRDTRGQKIIANGWRAKLAFAWRDEKRRREREAEDRRKKETIGVKIDDDNYQIRL